MDIHDFPRSVSPADAPGRRCDALKLVGETPSGLLLFQVVRTPGEMVAWCKTHLWGSIPGVFNEVREARCPGCEMDRDIYHRRVWLMHAIGIDAFEALLQLSRTDAN